MAEEIYFCAECGWVRTPYGYTGKCPQCHSLMRSMRCSRCMHAWWPKNANPPKVCPRCKSPYWNKARSRFKGDRDNYMGDDDDGN